LFVGELKLQAGKANYKSHTGSAPMSVVLALGD
jgi:hypothetical protein